MQELFRASSGHSIFATVNGKCVKDPSSKASDLDSKSLLGLETASNRDIIGIALANLIVSKYKIIDYYIILGRVILVFF